MTMRTQVAIIGGGPSGLLLSHLLYKAGIETVILEKQSREYVLSRIRAGVLEWGTVDLLQKAGLGNRMAKEGFIHNGTYLSSQNRGFRIDFDKLIKNKVMVYGQTEVTSDLYKASDSNNIKIIHHAKNVKIYDIETDSTYLSYNINGVEKRLDCDFVAGCDGFHGISRKSIPQKVLKEFERIYPFGWLGVLSETPPVSEELIYANHSRGFALCSMRNSNLSRYYIQTPVDDNLEAWDDNSFWEELKKRIPEESAETLITGPSIEKSIAPLRSFIANPLRWGNLFLVGDAAHIVPPTGAKGLNLAVSDVYYLFEGLKSYYQEKSDQGIKDYSEKASNRAWKAIRFSWWMTTQLHRFPKQTAFDQKIQEAELRYLEQSTAAQTVFAENYVGLPF